MSTSSASPATCACFRRSSSPRFPIAFSIFIPRCCPRFRGLKRSSRPSTTASKVAGCTVHFVDEQLDHGAIIVQRAIPVLDYDDEHSLAERILAEEHLAYTEAIARVVSGDYEVRGRRYIKKSG